eukprot:m.157471 g.157471  ORF g.157471 m.157471 type:complete len:188 (-) comp15118_c0_seq7:240-803(-)
MPKKKKKQQTINKQQCFFNSIRPARTLKNSEGIRQMSPVGECPTIPYCAALARLLARLRTIDSPCERSFIRVSSLCNDCDECCLTFFGLGGALVLGFFLAFPIFLEILGELDLISLGTIGIDTSWSTSCAADTVLFPLKTAPLRACLQRGSKQARGNLSLTLTSTLALARETKAKLFIFLDSTTKVW